MANLGGDYTLWITYLPSHDEGAANFSFKIEENGFLTPLPLRERR